MIGRTIIKKLNQDKVGVLATDTLYGLVGRALSPNAVQRIYQMRRRNRKKPLIILISEIEDLDFFEIKLTPSLKRILGKFWPGPISFILPCEQKKFQYLHRGTKTLAFRLPDKPSLIRLIKRAGPLVAPSANIEGQPPAKTIAEAKKYFGNKADFYLNAGKIISLPSTVVAIKAGKVFVNRRGIGTPHILLQKKSTGKNLRY